MSILEVCGECCGTGIHRDQLGSRVSPDFCPACGGRGTRRGDDRPYHVPDLSRALPSPAGLTWCSTCGANKELHIHNEIDVVQVQELSAEQRRGPHRFQAWGDLGRSDVCVHCNKPRLTGNHPEEP